MWTLAGLRRRGYTPQAVRAFAERSRIGKREGVVDMGFLEFCLREDLNARAERRMAVIDPLKVVLENYPEGQVEHFACVNNPEDPSAGTRSVPFSRELWIERDDFREVPPRKFHRLSPGKEVRLRSAYLITCTQVVKNAQGEVVELRCTYDPATRGGDAPDGRKVKGTLHWVSAAHALDAEVRLYDRLMKDEHPSLEGRNAADLLNPASLELRQGKLEPSLAEATPDRPVQFERLGYFVADSADSRPGHLVFNRAVALRDSWAKIEAREE
jgi:glutaminyl-tRNA synthetase